MDLRFDRGTTATRQLVRISVVLALLIACATTLRAQNDVRVAHVDTRDGLSQGVIHSVMQDRHGFMWFGTRDGLDRYDGYSFRSFCHDPYDTTSLSDYQITAVAEDSLGYIWAGTVAGGLNRLDRRTGRARRYRHDPLDSHSLSSDGIVTVGVDRRGDVFVMTVRGLHRFDPARERFDRIRHVARDARWQLDTLAMFVDLQGELWVCSSGGRNGEPTASSRSDGRCVVGRYDPGTRTFRNWELQVVPGCLRIIGQASDGGIDVAYYGAQYRSQAMVHRLDPSTGRVRRFTVASALATGAHRRMFVPFTVQADSILLFAGASLRPPAGPSIRGGLYRERLIPMDASTSSSTTTNYATSSPLTPCTLTLPYVDRAGTCWMPTASGLALITSVGAGITTWRHSPLDTTTLSSATMRGVEFDRQGRLWVSTDFGLNRYDSATRRWLRYFATGGTRGLQHNVVNVIYREPRGRLLMGTYFGVATVDAEARPRPLPLPGVPVSPLNELHIWSILRDRSNRLWLGDGSYGLVRIESDGRRFRRFQNDPHDPASLTAGGVWCLLEDRHGTIWIGTDEGLCRFNPSSGNFRRYVHEPGNHRSIGGKRIWALYEDTAANLWISSYGGGISRYDSATDDFTTITARDGLVTNSVVGLLEDDDGDFWIGTTRGLVRWNRRANTFRLYDELDGLQGNEFAFKSFAKGPDGRLYFGGVAGLSAIRPEAMRPDRYVPPLAITQFRIFDSLAFAEILDGDTVRLASDESNFSIEFAALGFINPRKNKYAYRLVGIDRDWIMTGADNRVASYMHLSPGEYTFQLRGSNADGVWNEEGISVTIIIAPPWWATWVFRSSATAMLGLLLFVGYRARTRSIRGHEREKQERVLAAALESQEAERQRIARDLHDGVGQLLAAVWLNLERVRELCDGYHRGPNPLEAPINRTIGILNHAIADVRTISHGLGTSTLRELGLAAAIDELLESMPSGHVTRFELVTLAMERRPAHAVESCLFRVTQELVANILHHAEATEATIQIVRDSEEVRLTVEDNGRGFAVDRPHMGMGLQNICARAAAMHGEVHVDSAPGRGTTITVVLPTTHDLP